MATIDDVLASADQILSSSPGKGAAMGALMGQLLSSYGQGAGGVNLGVDMSKVGNIPTRSLTAYQPKYRTYAEYGARDLPLGYIDPALARALGVSSAMPTNLRQISQYSAKPSISTESPLSITSAGSGAGKLTSPSLTPASDVSISPITGALLGAAIGAMAPQSSSSSSGSAGSTAGALTNLGGGLSSLYKNLGSLGSSIWNLFKGSGDSTSGSGTGTGASGFPIDSSIGGGSVADTVINDSGFTIKDGGLVTPLMADGGAVNGYYTYGSQIDPQEILNGYAHGGSPHPGGLQSMVEGRVDYRDGDAVTGAGDGQSDDIPAMLADGEFVIDAETVAQLGNGSTKAGSNLLDEFRKAVREHKRSAPVDKIPPASSPLQYMKTAMANAKERNHG